MTNYATYTDAANLIARSSEILIHLFGRWFANSPDELASVKEQAIAISKDLNDSEFTTYDVVGIYIIGMVPFINIDATAAFLKQHPKAAGELYHVILEGIAPSKITDDLVNTMFGWDDPEWHTDWLRGHIAIMRS